MFKKILRIWFVFTHSLILLNLLGCTDGVLPLKKGAVSGRVYDSNNLSIKGAILTSHRSLHKAETDENGCYSFPSLDLGTHNFTVERDGYYLGSASVELKSGEAIENFDIRVEAHELTISHWVSVRELTRAVIDVECFQPMAITMAWKEKNNHRIQNAPTELAKSHRIELTNLRAGVEYQYFITGTTENGQVFVAADGEFRSRASGDLDGPPEKPHKISVIQGKNGPIVEWEYVATEPLRGFRVLRGIEDGPLSVYVDESIIFDNENSFEDREATPGNLYRYAVMSVDLDYELSEPTEAVTFVPAGTIANNLVWRAKHSPIRIDGDIIIPEKYSLVIEPGTTVVFGAQDKRQGGYDPLKCELLVMGCLYAEGVIELPINFISASSMPTKKDWSGIRVVKTEMSIESIIKNVVVSGAEGGLELLGSCTQLENISARYCDYGLKLNTASGTEVIGFYAEDCNHGLYALNTQNTLIEGFRAKKCLVGARLAANKNLVFKDFDLRELDEIGIESVDRENTQVYNGVIQSKDIGLLIGGAPGLYQQLTIDALNGIEVSTNEKSTIKNNIIANLQYAGQGYGIEEKSAQNNSYPYNNIFGYSMATQGCNQSGAIIQNVDPKFVGGATGAAYNYHLKSNSPLLTSSDTLGELGAYGGN
jgi:hypothetical protein